MPVTVNEAMAVVMDQYEAVEKYKRKMSETDAEHSFAKSGRQPTPMQQRREDQTA